MHSHVASFGILCPNISPPVPVSSRSAQKPPSLVTFPVSDSKFKPEFMLTAPHSQSCNRGQSDVFRACAQLPEAAGDKLPNVSSTLETALSLSSEIHQEVPPPATSFSAFMAQVTDLVKLVDSKDIVELELKQLDCEVIIRKKEALSQPPVPQPVLMTPPPAHQTMPPAQATSALAAVAPPAAIPPSQASGPKPVASVKPKSSHPAFKSPMAGNFYRSSAPGSPHFVKVGDKVQKGQVLCIIEAMKLMNEIEVDQSGTVIEVLAEDGKPVTVDTPLFVIEP